MSVIIQAEERDIEDFLCEDLGGYLDLHLIDRQVNTPAGIIDILAKSEKFYYVIELKKGVIDAHALAQVLRYTNYLNDNKSKNGKRFFVPVLIGSHLADGLQRSVYYLETDNESEAFISRVFYRCFDFSPKEGIRFNFFDVTQQAYEEAHLNINFHYADTLEDKHMQKGVVLK